MNPDFALSQLNNRAHKEHQEGEMIPPPRISIVNLTDEKATAFRCAYIALKAARNGQLAAQAIARIYDLNLDYLYAAKWSDIKPEGKE